jgi:hypothetical protein
MSVPLYLKNIFNMMKTRNFLVVVQIVMMGFLMNVSGQEAMDTIFKIEGKVMPVDVVKVTSSYVSFTVPGNNQTFTIERKEVQKIVYKNGRVEVYNKPVFEMLDENSWEAIWLTEDKAEVKDLYKRGEVSANSPASARSPKAAKTSATIRLKKKASAMKGTVVLITKKLSTGGYGEYPGYYLEGAVYGTEPLSEGETIKSDKDTPNK